MGLLLLNKITYYIYNEFKKNFLQKWCLPAVDIRTWVNNNDTSPLLFFHKICKVTVHAHTTDFLKQLSLYQIYWYKYCSQMLLLCLFIFIFNKKTQKQNYHSHLTISEICKPFVTFNYIKILHYWPFNKFNCPEFLNVTCNSTRPCIPVRQQKAYN
jgi:hypothetical protein